MLGWVEILNSEKEKMAEELTKLQDVKYVYPSDANFLLVKIENAREKYEMLVNNGIIVRDRSKVELCGESLRISIGTPDENQQLMAALK